MMLFPQEISNVCLVRGRLCSAAAGGIMELRRTMGMF